MKLIKTCVFLALILGSCVAANAQGSWTMCQPGDFYDYDGSNPDINWTCSDAEVYCVNNKPAGIRFDTEYEFNPPHLGIFAVDVNVKITRTWTFFPPVGPPLTTTQEVFNKRIGSIGVDESHSDTVEWIEPSRQNFTNVSYEVTATLIMTNIFTMNEFEADNWGAQVPDCTSFDIMP